MSLTLQLEPLVYAGLAVCRILTFLMAVPVLGMRTIPPPVKVALALWLAWAITPMLARSGTPPPMSPGGIALGCAGEVLAGLLVAFGVAIVFATVQMAGQVLGVQMAFSIVNVVDPQTQSQVSALSQIYYLLAILLFLSLDGPLLVLGGFYATFEALPVGIASFNPAGLFAVVNEAGGLFSGALRIAAPPVVTLLLVSVVLGIMGRTVPQLNVLVLGFPLKILVGLLVILVSLPLFLQAMGHAFTGVPDRMLEAAFGLRGR